MTPSPDQRPLDEMDREALLAYIMEEHRSIRRIAHDVASPIGILRLAMHVLQSMNPDVAKREQYYDTMVQAIDKLESQIRRMRGLTEPLQADGMEEEGRQ
jgi:nitrogen-specific signal transduction histidine kinase